MSKFKVGDIVVGRPEASERYGITKEGWKGRVIEVREDDLICAEGISEDTTPYCIDGKFFDLVTEEKQKETGMKTKFEVGDLVIGKKLVGNPVYAITGEGWVGEVKSVAEEDYIEVVDLEGKDVWEVDPTHFDLVYKKGEYCKGSRKFLMEAYKSAGPTYIPKIRSILSLDPISGVLPVPKSLIDKALSVGAICSEWKSKIREEFKYEKENTYFDFGETTTISDSFRGKPIMIGHGLVSDEEKNHCLLVSSEYELIVEDFKHYKKLKFKKK